jgi:hypothetical protein
MNITEATTTAEKHRADHVEGETCWQCEPRRTTTTWNRYLALVEDPERRCRWCDGTGWYLSACHPRAENAPIGAGDVWRPCGQCGASGERR